MTSSSNHRDMHDPELPIDLRDVASLADRLGAHERAAAATGLEDGVFRSTRLLLGEAPQPIPFPSHERRAVFASRWRIAAAVAIVGALGLTVVGWRVMSTGSLSAVPTGHIADRSHEGGKIDVAELEADLNRLFAATTPWAGGSSTEIASLSSDVDSLAGASDPWIGADSGLDEIVNEDSL